MKDSSNRGILLTGASGYIGIRVLRRLENRRDKLRCISRNPDFLRPRCLPATEIVECDVRDPKALREAMRGMSAAYYLVDSGAEPDSDSDADRLAARQFSSAAREAGLKRIIYLSGLGQGTSLSKHMGERHDVGRILRGSGVPTIEFRASPVIGSGSTTFELIRSIAETLPIIATPRWMRSVVQPISVEDVADYLDQALDLEIAGHRVFEIGGADQVTLEEIIREYAHQRGIRRLIIPVPVSMPSFSAIWLTVWTSLHGNIARRIIDVVRNGSSVRNDLALQEFPLKPRTVSEAMARALAGEDEEFQATKWSVALSSSGPRKRYGGVKFGSRLIASETVLVNAPPDRAFAPIEQIGGERGWYYGNWMWYVRGLVDQIVGGVGLRRGRRDPDVLLAGDPLDFFRVSRIEPGRFLQLEVEMKVPGRAWLQFEVDEEASGSRIRLSAIYDPIGLLGLLYWYSMYPFHLLIFKGMLRQIASRADRNVTKPGGKEAAENSELYRPQPTGC